MKQLFAFTGKELMELIRTGKFLILAVIFILFGIMNPAIAKLTPWMMEFFADSFTETGITVSANLEVNAMTSWVQFYKNVPLALLIFLLLSSSILTSEYQKGTLINMLTKGMSRWKIIASKTFSIMALWTVGYWLCYGITYGYNFYFWDNGIASHLIPAAGCFYLFGLWLISLLMLMSTLFSTSSAVLASVGSIFLILYLFSFLPALQKYLPVKLLSSAALLGGSIPLSEYRPALFMTVGLSVSGILLSVICFNRKAI